MLTPSRHSSAFFHGRIGCGSSRLHGKHLPDPMAEALSATRYAATGTPGKGRGGAVGGDWMNTLLVPINSAR